MVFVFEFSRALACFDSHELVVYFRWRAAADPTKTGLTTLILVKL